MGFYIFILPILFVFSPTILFLGICCVLGTFVAAEELQSVLFQKNLNSIKKVYLFLKI